MKVSNTFIILPANRSVRHTSTCSPSPAATVCFGLFSDAIMEHSVEKQLEEEMDYFSSCFKVTVHHWKKSG